jgi:putative Mn2+ efflux pump MntP
MPETRVRKQSFMHQHALSIASTGILVLWIGLYIISSPKTHIGSFFGNAIADWSGVVVMVFATKYLYEKDRLKAGDHRRNS